MKVTLKNVKFDIPKEIETPTEEQVGDWLAFRLFWNKIEPSNPLIYVDIKKCNFSFELDEKWQK